MIKSIGRLLRRLKFREITSLSRYNTDQSPNEKHVSKGKEALKRLKTFIRDDRETAERINREFAKPYVDLSGVLNDVDSNYDHKLSENLLYSTAFKGILHKPAIDMKYIMSHQDEVEANIRKRKLPGVDIDIQKDIIDVYKQLQKVTQEKKKFAKQQEELTVSMKEFWISYEKDSTVPPEIEKTRREAVKISCKILLLSWIETEMGKMFYEKALLLPNRTHPSVPIGDESESEIIKSVNLKPEQNFPAIDHLDVGESTGIIRQKEISNFTGQRAYFLRGAAAELEQALVRYTLDKLRSKNFEMILGPNLLHGSMFEACGVASTKIGDLLYHLDDRHAKDFYIAGTSEVSIATYLANHAVALKDLPLRLCSVSTCNRTETDTRYDPRGLFRVHHFTKVEMFGVTANESGEESDQLFDEFVQIQEEIFTELELHFRIINMPTMELGLPAYRKVDMEAWMPARDAYGEISSASNCTDFQSRRLHILYKSNDKYRFAHTLNGTACAVPRLIVALLESNQTQERTVQLPKVLHPYLSRNIISRVGRKTIEYIGPRKPKNKLKLPDE